MEPLANAIVAPLKKLNFEYAFQPIYQFLRFIGLWPFSVIHYSNGKIHKARMRVFDVLRSTSIICLNLLLSVERYKHLRAGQAVQAMRIRFTAFNVFHRCSFLFTAIGSILNVVNRNRLVDLLKKFNTFDNEVRNVFFAFFPSTWRLNEHFCLIANRYQNSAFNSISSVVIVVHCFTLSPECSSCCSFSPFTLMKCSFRTKTCGWRCTALALILFTLVFGCQSWFHLLY